MDITLERILSLIQHKPDGKFVHGAKKEFAESIGFDSGDIISMWIKGTSTSYRNYVYQIANLYNVSADWLLGLTDEKSPMPTDADNELSGEQQELIQLVQKMPPEQVHSLLTLLQGKL